MTKFGLIDLTNPVCWRGKKKTTVTESKWGGDGQTFFGVLRRSLLNNPPLPTLHHHHPNSHPSIEPVSKIATGCIYNGQHHGVLKVVHRPAWEWSQTIGRSDRHGHAHERVEEIKWRWQIVYKWKEWKRHKLWQKWKWFRLPDTFPLKWSKLWTGHSKIFVNVLGLITLQLCQALVPFLERHGNLHTMSPTGTLNNKGLYCAQPTFPCWTRSLEFSQNISSPELFILFFPNRYQMTNAFRARAQETLSSKNET